MKAKDGSIEKGLSQVLPIDMLLTSVKYTKYHIGSKVGDNIDTSVGGGHVTDLAKLCFPEGLAQEEPRSAKLPFEWSLASVLG